MARRKIETPTVPGSIVVDLKNGKTLEKALPAVICSRIKFFREKPGMEQKALAAQIGVTFNAVSSWEDGRSRPDLKLIPAICAALHISLYDLCGRVVGIVSRKDIPSKEDIEAYLTLRSFARV